VLTDSESNPEVDPFREEVVLTKHADSMFYIYKPALVAKTKHNQYVQYIEGSKAFALDGRLPFAMNL
jgi:hypothetical protein